MAREADTRWFTEARFGMFVHWGLYSIPAGVWKGQVVRRNWYAEWIRAQAGWPEKPGIPKDEYDELLKEFNPRHFNADEWILEAKNAGMKYFLITAKHHDGFAMWPSKVSRYNVAEATPFGRDVCGELAAACKRHGIRLGFYYSHWLDWEYPGGCLPPWPKQPEDPVVRQPSQEAFERYWTEKCLPQVAELIASYDPAFMWFDNWEKAEHLTPGRIEQLIGVVKKLSSSCLVNSRIGTTWNHPEGDKLVDYFSMYDNTFPEKGPDFAWETSATMNRSWGYHQADFEWKPTRQLLRHLVDNASRGGNFQLNIGPMADGRIPAPSIRRLREIGAWMAVNGEAIYGTQTCPSPEPAWGRITMRRDGGKTILYLHVYDWKADAQLTIERIAGKAVTARVLETGQAVQVAREGDSISITLPKECPDERIAVVAVEVEGAA